MTEIRRCRHILKQSQREFAHTLGVGIEAYRTWDAGRRTTPDSVLLKARTLIETGRDVPVALRVLAGELHVNVRTLRAAAQDGRLAATFGARPYFGKIAAMSTRTRRHSSWRCGTDKHMDAGAVHESGCVASSYP